MERANNGMEIAWVDQSQAFEIHHVPMFDTSIAFLHVQFVHVASLRCREVRFGILCAPIHPMPKELYARMLTAYVQHSRSVVHTITLHCL
jgi:hypothetical protein